MIPSFCVLWISILYGEISEATALYMVISGPTAREDSVCGHRVLKGLQNGDIS